MSDILEAQRRKRNRPAKLQKTRDASLLNADEQSKEDQITEQLASEETPLSNPAIKTDNPVKTDNSVEALKMELAELPEVAKRRIVRLEESLDRRLAEFLANNKDLTLDVLLEALFTELESNDRLQNRVLKGGSKRYWERKRAGQIKRLLSQLE